MITNNLIDQTFYIFDKLTPYSLNIPDHHRVEQRHIIAIHDISDNKCPIIISIGEQNSFGPKSGEKIFTNINLSLNASHQGANSTRAGNVTPARSISLERYLVNKFRRPFLPILTILIVSSHLDHRQN